MPTRWPIRAYLLIAAIALSLLAVVVGYTFAARAGAPASTIAAHPPVTLPGGAWQAIALPMPAEQLRTYAVGPNDSATIFTCSGPSAGPLAVWYTHDTGAHWTRAALPATPGMNACDIAFAPNRPGRVAVLLTQRAAASATLALSDDDGATWRAITYRTLLPNGTIPSWNQILLSARSVYFVTSYFPGSMVNGAGVAAGPQATQLERSEDGGATWVRADGPFDGTLFMPWQLGDGDTLLASVLRDQHPGQESGPELWITHDGGRTWRQSAVLPAGVGTFVLVPQRPGVASGPTPAAPYYALIGEQLPISLYRLRVLQSGDGQHWTALPQLPVPGASPTRAGYLQALGVAPDGRLLVFGPDPLKGVPADGAANGMLPSVWLWLWDPRAARWEVLATPLQAASGGCGLCWFSQLTTGPDGATYLYVSAADSASPLNHTPGIFRVRLPAATSQ